MPCTHAYLWLTCTRLRMDARRNLLLLIVCLPLLANCLPIIPSTDSAVASSTVHSSERVSSLRLLDTNERLKASETEAVRRTGVADSGTIPLEMTETRMRRAVIRNKINKWPNATIPYDFDRNFPLTGRRKVLRAINHWHKKTCIKFIPHTDEKYYIKFVLSPYFCLAYTGMQIEAAEREGYDGQLVFLTNDCVDKRGTILHELGHVIGFFHEHNRPDRDNFIEIQWDNVREDLHDQFDKIPASDIDSLGVPYDFGSIMHYSLDAFSKNGNATMKVISNPRGYTGEVGQRQGLSDLDARQANLLYSCLADEKAIDIPAFSGNLLITGQKIGLKATGTSRQLWMGCNGEKCELGGCPGNRFKSEKRTICMDYEFSLHKLNGTSRVRFGDEVVLRQEINGTNKVVFCDAVGGVCVPSTQCEVNGEFSRRNCVDQVLVVKSASKQLGEQIKSNDHIILEYLNQGVSGEDTTWSVLKCNLDGPKRCQRQVCNPNVPDSGSGMNVNLENHVPTSTTSITSCSTAEFDLHKLS